MSGGSPSLLHDSPMKPDDLVESEQGMMGRSCTLVAAWAAPGPATFVVYDVEPLPMGDGKRMTQRRWALHAPGASPATRHGGVLTTGFIDV